MKNDTERACILLHEKDNTLTALLPLSKGHEISDDIAGTADAVFIQQDIPYAHKFARVDIPAGADIIKYGEVIGIATAGIRAGEHVHVHNVDSKRAGGSSS